MNGREEDYGDQAEYDLEDRISRDEFALSDEEMDSINEVTRDQQQAAKELT